MTNRKPLPSLVGSQYVPLHTSSHFRDLLGDIPDWDAAREALVRLGKVKLGTVSEPIAALAADAVDGARDGTLTAETLLKAAANACRATEATLMAQNALTDARTELLHDLDSALQDAWPDLFEALQAEHDRVWRALAEIADPCQLLDADTAIAAHRVEDYRQWRQLLDQNSAVRTRYEMLSRHSGMGDPKSILNLIRNPAEWDLYPAWAEGHELNHLSTGEIERIVPPWESNGTVGSAEWITWALASEFTIWLPTPSELDDAEQKLEEHVTEWRNTYDPDMPLTRAGWKRETRRVHNQMHDDH
ncbi:MAG TPA: hypothetical protein VNS81_00180 [Nocardioides sp.]|nr:hypothetical protein [Nocardioides sp.]